MHRELDTLGAPPAPDRGAAAALDTLVRLADQAGAPEIASEAAALAERLNEGRFYVACLGQFKRGKSTLLNALVGQALLPAGIVPITTAVTVLRWGAELRARVRLAQAWRDIGVGELAAYVSEEQNPSNRKGVSLVEVFVPSPLLADGLCLVDTPGVGSVIRANTDATRDFVPQIDAALVVIGTDPPISGEELALVEAAAAQVGSLLFVLSKADRSTDAERREAVAFTRRVLAERLRTEPGPVLQVSALDRLTDGRSSGDWEALEQALRSLSASAGGALLDQAAARGIERLTERLRNDVDEQRRALARPIAETERHVEALGACVADGRRALNELRFLFAAEQKRLLARYADELRGFVERELPVAAAELTAALQTRAGRRGALRREALTLARAIADRSVHRWLEETEPRAEALYREAAERFADLANGLLERVARDGGLATLPPAVSPQLGFRSRRLFVAIGMMRTTRRRPIRWIADQLRAPAAARRTVERDAHAFLATLIRGNAGRVADDLDRRVIKSRQALELEIHAALEQITASAVRALARARTQHEAGHDAAQAELARLDALRTAVAGLARAPGDGGRAQRPGW
ncbi:MAG: dynamin family protein [Deltaproteobacteria bacterium]|nr:dynamin family protein [Deltaproteobacteria bacterium]